MDTRIIKKNVQKKFTNNRYQGSPITEDITNGFFTVDQKWTVTQWNKASEKLSGFDAKDILGKNLWKKFPEATALKFYKACHQAFLQDIPIHFEQYWALTETWFDIIAYHLDNTLSVSFKRIAHNYYPETPEQPQQQHSKLANLYRFITEVTNDALWEWDLVTKQIFWIDGGHKRAFGYEIENSIVPQNFWESRLHPDDKVRVLVKLNKIISERSGSLWEDEYRFKKVDSGYAYVHDRGHIIYEKGKASRMIGATQDITSRKLTEIELTQERLTRHIEITDAVRTAQERERTDIGRELHDNVNQILSAAKLYIGMAKNEKVNNKKYLEKSSVYLLNGIEEIRRICKMLVPLGMYHIGLADSIKNIINDLEQIQPVQIEFDDNGIDLKDMDQKLKITIFRIVQEQLNNIIRHSEATSARIDLSGQQNEIILTISDNGKGCDILKVKKGVGIINIKSRVEFYNGSVLIISEPGGGFTLKVVLPFITAEKTEPGILSGAGFD
jgi:PAS domain S-box-containing protein